MRQFCWRQFKHHPKRHNPSQAKKDIGVTPLVADGSDAAGDKQTAWPEGDNHQHQIGQRWRAMGFLSRLQFIHQITFDGDIQKSPIGGAGDHQNPRQHKAG